MKKTLTVADYIDTRNSQSYGKTIRVLDEKTHRNMGNWWEKTNANRPVKNIKISPKYLYIFI